VSEAELDADAGTPRAEQPDAPERNPLAPPIATRQINAATLASSLQPGAEVPAELQTAPPAAAPSLAKPASGDAAADPAPAAEPEPAATAATAVPDAPDAPDEPAGPPPSLEKAVEAPKAKNPLVPRVLKHANRLHAYTKQSGRTELADRIQAEAVRWKDQRSNVVVAGDIKRGKSSFINALVGEIGLLPVDADVATSVYLLVHHADELAITVTPRTPDGESGEAFAIRPDQLKEYASMAGEAGRGNQVAAVDIGLPHEMLERGIALIDTPGVGGMARGHKDVTLATLNLADALIFTVSAQEPVLRSELEFLLEATERIGTIVFVLTKIDVNSEWERLLEENRAKIREFARQLEEKAQGPSATDDDRAAAKRFARVVEAPFLPVSSRLYEKAVVRERAGRAEQAAEMFDRSGFGALEKIFEATATSRENIRLLNIVQLSESITARIEAEERERVRGAEGDPNLEADLAGEQAKLEAFVGKQARWRQRFATAIQRAQTEVNAQINREIAAVENAYRAEIENPSRDMKVLAEELPQELSHSVNACWWNLSSGMAQRLNAAVVEVVQEFELENLAVEVAELKMTDRVTDAAGSQGINVATGFDMVEDGLPFASGTMMGMGLGAKVLGGAMLGPMGLVLGLGIGAGMVALRRGKRIDMKTKQEYLKAVRESLGVVKQEFVSEMALRIIEFRTEIEELVDERLTQRRKELEEQRKELVTLLKQDMGERKKVRAEAEARIKTVTELHSEALKFRQQVEAALKR
jgi:predicted GTPase